MQKDVILFMGSHQTGGSVEDDQLQLITTGQYYHKNGKHYVIYEELSDSGRHKSKNTIKIYEGGAEVLKSGESSIHMVFGLHKKTLSYYDMPYGKLLVGLETNHMDLLEEENRIRLRLDYRLEVDYQHMADCEVEIRIESRDVCEVKLG
ncbi:MAG: DUF1934 domain-containing protein [Lachnospiraceae bacterium]|jgi:uncharacterized beta-barrel protein YwiB (DUF1934 family)|nr:DUF1934 domain-containing protein [Lachnospiraceae bacterium]